MSYSKQFSGEGGGVSGLSSNLYIGVDNDICELFLLHTLNKSRLILGQHTAVS